MDVINQEDLWFSTPATDTLCRGGHNGPDHPTQLYALKKYWNPLSDSILDYGAGSGTTYEAIQKAWPEVAVRYRGLDVIKKNADWCNKHFKTDVFHYNDGLHVIDAEDKSFDLVYSRHVVDHMDSFEKAMDEHKRVARNMVIVVGWVPLSNQDDHEIKNIDFRPSSGRLYPDEYTNIYSRKKVQEYLKDPEWEVLEFSEEVGVKHGGHDWVIVLRKKVIDK